MRNDVPLLYQQASAYDRMFTQQEDAAFHKTLVRGGDCLEICCGTGRMLLELAAAGVEAHGLDFSAQMLDEARNKAAARGLTVHLHQGDMRAFDLGRTFSTIFIVLNSFCHLYTLDDVQRHLQAVRRHARMDTLYIVDIFTPRLDLLLRSERTHIMDFSDPNDNLPVAVYEESRYDNATQMKLNRWLYEKAGSIVAEGELPMRIFFPQELDALLTLNGFRIAQKFGDYDGSAYGDGSPHQIVLCEPTV